MPPTYTPRSKAKESTVSIPKVKGRSKATPMVADRPGRKPKIMPATTPKMQMGMVSPLKIEAILIMCSPPIKIAKTLAD
jgi:hypothetical protein